MSKKRNLKKQHVVKKITSNWMTPFIGAFILIIAVYFIINAASGGGNTYVATDLGDIKILKSDITEKARFYPYNAGGTKLEVVAVKASDGTIRTVFNTCQNCSGSPKAYYKQEGDELVCQNCGNRFKIDMLQQERKGCNPVPILVENRSEDEKSITIRKDFIERNKYLFTNNWKSK